MTTLLRFPPEKIDATLATDMAVANRPISLGRRNQASAIWLASATTLFRPEKMMVQTAPWAARVPIDTTGALLSAGLAGATALMNPFAMQPCFYCPRLPKGSNGGTGFLFALFRIRPAIGVIVIAIVVIIAGHAFARDHVQHHTGQGRACFAQQLNGAPDRVLRRLAGAHDKAGRLDTVENKQGVAYGVDRGGIDHDAIKFG